MFAQESPRSQALVESHYSLNNGHMSDAKVVYGDTDSVMINFCLPNETGPTAVAQAMQLAREAAEHVTATFPAPICLEFEKVYRPYMLFSKKRYAGLLYSSNADTHDYMDVKGLQNVRRDSCLLLRRTYDECLRLLLVDGDVHKAEDHLKGVIERLRNRSVSPFQLLLSKKLTKTEYKHKTIHSELVKRLASRDPSCVPAVGDRISYVIVENAANGGRGKAGVVADLAEDPLFALQQNLPINVEWYIDHQLRKPMVQLFSLVVQKPQSLFSGKQNMIIKKKVAPQSAMMKRFVKVSARCLGCNCVLPSSPQRVSGSNKALCGECVHLKSQLTVNQAEQVTNHQQRRDLLWTKCGECAGSDSMARVCRNTLCETFYDRYLADQALSAQEGQRDRLAW